MRWIPDRWDQFVGNRRMRAEFRRIVQMLRKYYNDTGRIPAEILLSLLLTGPSRSGKTAMTKFAVRCLVCQELDDDLNPAGGHEREQRPDALLRLGMQVNLWVLDEDHVALPGREDRDENRKELRQAESHVLRTLEV